MNTLIIDDERLARKELASLLSQHKQVNIIGEAENAEEAIALIERHQPELVFLDIQMPGKSGFDLLEELIYVPRVIFVTAYDDYAIKAFDYNALDYLLKPVEENRLREAIKKVSEDIAASQKSAATHKLNQQDHIFIKDGNKCWFVALTDIRMFESEGNYVRVYFDKFKPLVLKSLSNLEERLDEKMFFRANRRFIINLRCVEHVEPWFNGGLQVRLKTGESIEISRRQASRFKDMLSL